jgi:hypothetical protein
MDNSAPARIFKGEIVALVREWPWVQTPACLDLLQRAGNEIPGAQLGLYVNAEGLRGLELMHSHEPDRGLAGI